MNFPSTFRWLFAAALSATVLLLGLNHFVLGSGPAPTPSPTALPPTSVVPAAAPTSNKIQIAFLLDTSGSMEGLIDQAKARLWNILNEAMTVTRDGEAPDIEVALYQYGNDRLSARTGYIERIVPLTTDVDEISDKLFALTTSGGDEYCPLAIQTAANDLAWDTDEATVKLLYIAGNEEFQQGPIGLRAGLRSATTKGIVVNTILCADPDSPIAGDWSTASLINDGDFFAINQDEAVAYVDSPYDDRIEAANARLNQTYVPINAAAAQQQRKLVAQDANAASYGKANMSSRAKYKASKNYKNSSWDLVDAAERDATKVIKDKAMLPDSLRRLTDTELTAKIVGLSKKRARLKKELAELGTQRDAFVAEARQEMADTQTNTLGERIKSSMKKQLVKKGYKAEN